MHEYRIVGRKVPLLGEPEPQLFEMEVFAPNAVVAKSRFWHFLKTLKKIKKSNGEIVSMKEVFEKRPTRVKNYGIWLRYNSRSGIHNMYKEYRALSRPEAVHQCYQDMASRHAARFDVIQIIQVKELKNNEVKRQYVLQWMDPQLKFPMTSNICPPRMEKI